MDDRFSIKPSPKGTERDGALSMAAHHMQAIKSLVRLLMHEMEFLETISDDRAPSGESKLPLDKKLEEIEIELIRNALVQARGHQVRAAKILDVRTSTLNAKLKRFGIDPRVFVLASGHAEN